VNDIIRVQDKFYILVTSALGDDRTRVLKHGETFAVFDRYGDIWPLARSDNGVYHEGTRVLSRLGLSLNDTRPMLLSSEVVESNDVLVVHLSNPDLFLPQAGGPPRLLPRGSVHILRSKLLWNGVLYERLRVVNHDLVPVDIDLEVTFGADFADLFEVRGIARAARGEDLPPVIGTDEAVLSYRGLDGIVRRMRMVFSPAPSLLAADHARLRLRLDPRRAHEQLITVVAEIGDRPAAVRDYEAALTDNAATFAAMRAQISQVDSANEHFDNWVARSTTDLCMLTTETEHGLYPSAGVPWFSTVFGRDGIITALECLWAWPELARGVLSLLAATQADAVDPARDAEPGKILHESRRGEMANLGEIPFGRYYGSVDSTPLFVMLAGAYYGRTRDLAFAREIWPNVERALAWIDRHGDIDGDGFIEYARRSANGLSNQGWKDAGDSVFHANGDLATGPIALCEVQGYVYAARLRAAAMAADLGEWERADALRRQAAALADAFDRLFWCEDLGTYALALDGDKRPCRVRASNAGHCLWAGIARPERSARVARLLLSEEMFSGWGVRTVGVNEARYNPMSYHNGSVWPHDNALIAAGLAAYGHETEAMTITEGLFGASMFVDLHRLPELFCGFRRRAGEGPTLYPVACSPQAWAAGAVMLLVQSMLGLTLDAERDEIRLARPSLPSFLHAVEVSHLRLAGASADLHFEVFPGDVSVRVLRREGQVQVSVLK
jgi:glycogen debranching enzyme